MSTIRPAEDNADHLAIETVAPEHAGLAARDGETAVRRAVANLPSQILMDVANPKIDRWQATRALNANPATSHISIEPRPVVEEVRRHLAAEDGHAAPMVEVAA